MDHNHRIGTALGDTSSILNAQRKYEMSISIGNRRRNLGQVKPFDVTQMEDEVRTSLVGASGVNLDYIESHGSGGTVAVHPSSDGNYGSKMPLPDYVSHLEEVDQVGRLSAEAIIQQYETAAKQVEALGNEIKESAAKLEAALAEHDADMKLINETAQAIRDKGKAIFLQIENASHVTTELRRACVELKNKIK